MLSRKPSLGCSCQHKGFGAVVDYDVIVIGGKSYTANQILDKQILAAKDTPLFRGSDFTKPFRIVKAGQPIGQVYSYLKATGTTGKARLMFYDGANYTGTPFYALNEAVDTQFLKDQGTLTVQQEIKQEQDKKEKENDPIAYYVKKLGLPVLLIGGAIYLVATYGKEFIHDKIAKG